MDPLPSVQDAYANATAAWLAATGISTSNPHNNARYSASIDSLAKLEYIRLLLEWAANNEEQTGIIDMLGKLIEAVYRS